MYLAPHLGDTKLRGWVSLEMGHWKGRQLISMCLLSFLSPASMGRTGVHLPPFLSVPRQHGEGQKCYFWRMDKACFISGGAQGRARSVGLSLSFAFLAAQMNSSGSCEMPCGHGRPWAGGASSSRRRRLRPRAQKARPGLPVLWSGWRAGLLPLHAVSHAAVPTAMRIGSRGLGQ